MQRSNCRVEGETGGGAVWGGSKYYSYNIMNRPRLWSHMTNIQFQIKLCVNACLNWSDKTMFHES